jgi:mono/diheme cytochrome c family protein
MKLCIPAVVLTGLVLVGCSQSSNTNVANQPVNGPSPKAVATATPDQMAFARANYAKHCSACHGDDGKGGLVKVDNTRLKVPSLREGHAVGHPDDKLAKQITDGGDGMPKFKDKLTADEINQMVTFIRKEFQGK